MTATDSSYWAQRLAGLPRPVQDLPTPLRGSTGGLEGRLALLWASVQEPVLMCGALAQKAPEKIAHARQLLGVGLRAWRDLDLADDVTLPVRCGRSTHRVVLRSDGGFDLPSHPSLDVEAEQVSVALGAPALPCLVEVGEAARSHRAPSRDDAWARVEPVRAGQLFWWVRLLRAWGERGFSVEEAAPALHEGLGPDALAGHLDAGLDVPQAMDWRDVPPEEAQAWSLLRFTAEDRRTWTGAGHDYDDAVAALPVARDRERLLRWAHVLGEAVDAQSTAEWAAWGAPTGVWSEVARKGLPAAEVVWWQRELSPVGILAYVEHGVPLHEARRWKEAGWSAYVATGFCSLGISLEQAWEMRSHPARQVQQLWPRLHSVADVLAALERA